MSRRGDRELLSDIFEACRRIETFVEGRSYDIFRNDIKTQDAVIRNIEIIGEAVKLLSDDFKEKHSTIEWKKIAGMRNKLIHFYFGVNLDIVWSVAKTEIIELRKKVLEILRRESL